MTVLQHGAASAADQGHSTAPGETDLNELRERLLHDAEHHITLASALLTELRAFSEQVDIRARNPHFKGLALHVKALEKDAQVLGSCLKQLKLQVIAPESLKKIGVNIQNKSTLFDQALLRWDVLKRCVGFVAVNQTFQGTSREDRHKKVAEMNLPSMEKHEMHTLLRNQGRAGVDVVDWGRTWIDVRPITADRLARQMADAGWAWGEHETGDVVEEDEWAEMLLVKQTRRTVAAARSHRCEYHLPIVKLVLPNIARGENPDIDVLLEQLSRLDPFVKIIVEEKTGSFLATPPPPFEIASQRLIGHELDTLTSTVNLDHTILVDLVSDITNLRLTPQPWQLESTRTQIQEELDREGYMLKTLCPILKGRELVCTREAAQHLHDVLRLVGTKTEVRRAQLLVPWDQDTQSMSDADIRAEFQSLCVHDFPEDVSLPIQVIDHPWTMEAINRAVEDGKLPRVALDVAGQSGFKSYKLSIYTYGWAAGIDTVTSNREVVAQIRTIIEANRHDEYELGPRIWKVWVTRNLLAKRALSQDTSQYKEESMNGDR